MGQSVIEINGTRYDATTGQVIQPPVKLVHSGSNIDGIVPAHLATKPVLPAPSAIEKPRKVLASTRGIHDISMVQKSRVLKSKTLVRNIVGKPGGTTKTSPHTANPVLSSSSYSSWAHIDKRLSKALKTPLNNQVSRYMNQSGSNAHAQPTLVSDMPVISQQPALNKGTHSTPVVPSITNTSSTPAKRFVDAQLQKVGNEPSISPFKKAPIHRRIKAKLKTNKLRSIATSSLAILLIGGFVVYQNLPSITLVLANRESGISAKIPEGVPSNFALSPNIINSPGQVVLSFDSRVDDRKFTLTQLKAETTTASLKESVAEVSNDQFQTYEAGGITLFLSDNGRADWVKGGMRYNITGDTGFSPDQLAVIASSL